MKRLLCYSFMLSVLLATAMSFGALTAGVPVTDGLIIHLDSRMLNGYIDGDSVSLWPDSAVNDGTDGTVIEATCGDTTANLPTYKRNAYNDMPALHFNDADTQALASGPWTWDESQGVTIFIACTGGEANSDRAAQIGDAVGANFATVGCDVSSDASGVNATGSGVRYNNGWCLISDTGTTNPVVNGVWHTSVRQLAQGGGYGSLLYAVNNFPAVAPLETNQPTRNIAFNPGGNAIFLGNGPNNSGNWNGGSDWYNGDIAEVLVYNSQLTQQQMQDVLDYLKNKHLYAAQNPTPANDAVITNGQVSGNDLLMTLTWDTGKNPGNTAVVNPDITDHYLYISAGDPNFSDVTPIRITAAGTTGSHGPIALPLDTTYYWRIDEAANGSVADDPNTIVGPIWAFELTSYPVFVQQPEDAVVLEDENVAFIVNANCISDVRYQWYHAVNKDGTVDNVNDVEVGANSPILTLTNVQGADEGYYYCVASSITTGNSTFSDLALLGVKRLVAHYTLDLDDFQGGLYLDSSGEGHHVDPNIASESYFITGADATTAEALDVSLDPQASGTTGVTTNLWAPSFGTSELTITFWLNWHGPYPGGAFFQGVVTSRGDNEGNNFLVEIRPSNEIQINAQGDDEVRADLTDYIDKWVFVAITADNDRQVIYFNGKQMAVNETPDYPMPQFQTQLTLGVLNYFESGPNNWYLNGALDNVQIFNYAMTLQQVVDEYIGIKGGTVCLAAELPEGALDLDVSGPEGVADCVVNMYDLAVLSVNWLNCAFYPEAGCP